ncbi:MAG TPA: FMN-binding glutamate synthase family protein, partial [Flavobacteriales bacterium]|nr:FMN-binding glutamate synthase family protein [Flavobacteriales bacterium]
MQRYFFAISFILFALFGLVGWWHPKFFWAFAILGPLFLVGIWNMVQPRHTILRNFPLLGYFRYFFEFISPEIQQYFIERHTDGRPFSRQQRNIAYQRAKNVDDTTPFGTQLDINAANYEGIR